MSGRVQAPGGKSWRNNIVGDWALDAACRGMGVEADWWFPTAAGHGYRTRWTEEAQLAIRICKACPVVEACLAYALEHHEVDGIWGGMVPSDREQLRRANHVNLPKPMSEMDHGTERGCAQHRRRGEQPCPPCAAAASLAHQVRRHRKSVR